jgi:hypothetical protein
LNLGIESHVITDSFCFGAVQAAAICNGFPTERLIQYPHPPADGGDESAVTARWRSEFWRSWPGSSVSHLIAIERVGPSHTAESISRQTRIGDAPHELFAGKVAEKHRNCCHNMRGENINRFAGDVHLLFEESAVRPLQIKTIGIGDGANEIGMGTASWEDLERRLSGEHSGRVPCRIATDWNIVAGTSNWGGYALAAAVAHLRGNVSALAAFDAAHEQRVLEEMVEDGPAVDGVTRRREPTVDGLPFLTYIQPWAAIRAKLQLPE